MTARAAEVATVSALATVITILVAAPVLRAPSERVFGMEIVGRHHDPFTVMEQFARPVSVGTHSQPVTDVAGALLARLAGTLAAYNWLVLLSFPLSAAAAYMLARYLALSPAGATVAAIAYAFSPFHLAHAAYHPHIAQTQWLPLYLLAVWRCLDLATPRAMALLGAAAMAVTLSSFYGGLIAAAITPVAVAAHWLLTPRADARSVRRLVLTAGALLLISAGGIAYAAYAADPVLSDRSAFAFPRADLDRYSAKWWSYLMPPVAHPVLGPTARRVWEAAGVDDGLLEQQVSLGWGIVALALVAGLWWVIAARDKSAKGSTAGADRTDARESAFARVPILVIVATAALVCSLSPDWASGMFSFVQPSALLYDVVPMFRSYARFGVVVQLMAVLLAGIGVERLWRAGTLPARVACITLVALVAAEYAVSPSALSRDVLPTAAHRWVMQQAAPVLALDCTPGDRESESIRWLTAQRVTSGKPTSDCTEPNLSHKLAATGYTHLLVRRDPAGENQLAQSTASDGLRIAASFHDGRVFAVTAQPPPIYTAAMTGFSPREHNAERTWRWMGNDASWTVVNTGAQPVVAVLSLELASFHRARRMELRLDGRHVQTLMVEPERRSYEIGPFTVIPGGHGLTFHPADSPTVAGDVIGNGDQRPLSFALGSWSWTVQGGPP